jgi:hypothetical protein
MIKKFLKDIPLWYVAVFIVVYLPLYGVDYWIASLGGEMPIEFLRTRVLILCFFAGLLGFMRIKRCHPAFNSGYYNWLALTPWEFGKDLPHGSVFLTFSDGVVVAVLTLLAYFNDGYLTLTPVAACLGAYVLMTMYHLLVSKQLVYVTVFLFALPFAVYPHSNINISALAIVGFYGLAYMGQRRWLKQFPWNSVFWKYDQRKALLDNALACNIINWPYKMLRGDGFDKGMSLKTAFVVSSLLTWWLHVAGWAEKEVFAVCYFVVLLGAAFIRLFSYLSFGLPPISIAGRIVTGRLIIPGYDKIFIAPICVALVGFFMPEILMDLGISKMLSYKISFFIFMMLAFTLPPTLKNWCFTGFHRITKPVNSNTRVNRSSSDLFISNLIRETFGGKS